jgi:amicoumacin kinase
MIAVPPAVLDLLAPSFAAAAGDLRRYASGGEEGDGIVYTYPDGNTARLLKVMAFRETDQRRSLLCLNERLQFAHYLGQNGARIAYPRISPQGRLYETVSHGDYMWVAYAMDIAPGRTPSPQAWDPGFFRNWGQTVGLLHRLTQAYPSWRASIDPESGEEFLTWREEWQGFHDWCQDEEVRQKWVAIKEALEALPVTRDTFGFIHNDPHLWNLLVDGDRITVLDFDVANHQWFTTDIAIAFQSTLFAQTGGLGRPVQDRDKLLRFAELFLEGYEREHHLPQAWLTRLDLFIAYRRILMFIVMYGQIASNPETLAGWKHMILTQPGLLEP